MSFNWQGPGQAKVGSRLTLTLNTRSAQPVGSLGLVVSYDPSMLKAVEATEGSFLSQGGANVKFSKDIDQGNGQIALDMASSGEQGVQGSGGLAVLTFEVLAAGEAQISAERINPSGPVGETVNFTTPSSHAVSLSP